MPLFFNLKYEGEKMALTIPTASTEPSLQEVYRTIPFGELTPEQQFTIDLAWLKVEDGFDSMPGGPYLYDISRKNFNEQKMSLMFPYALERINYTFPNPPSPTFTLNDFPWTEHHTMMAQALTLEIIHHLIRSYVEVPLPIGSGNITLLDRTTYTTRWREIYTAEEEQFKNALRVFKRGYMQLGKARGLVDSKQGRLVPIPMRVRYPRFMGYR
jgi:hypothetical protein